MGNLGVVEAIFEGFEDRLFRGFSSQWMTNRRTQIRTARSPVCAQCPDVCARSGRICARHGKSRGAGWERRDGRNLMMYYVRGGGSRRRCMAKDGIIDVRREVKRRRVRTGVLAALCIVLPLMSFGASEYIEEPESWRRMSGFWSRDLLLRPTGSSGCCEFVSNITGQAAWSSQTSSWQHPSMEAGDIIVTTSLTIIKHRWKYSLYGLVDLITLGDAVYAEVSFQPVSGSCSSMPVECSEPLILQMSEVVTAEFSGALKALAAMPVAQRSYQHPGAVSIDRRFRASIFLAWLVQYGAWPALFLLLIFCGRNSKRLRRINPLLRGDKECPDCKYEMMEREPGVLLCSECGLRCRVGEG